MTALHVAAQAGRTDLVRYLLEKGANPGIVDSNGHKPIDLVGATAGNPAGGRGGAQTRTGAAGTAEIRALLENASKK
jgi:hypothetical protein